MNIDPSNRAAIVHRRKGDTTGYATQEGVTLYNTVAGCAQIITHGVDTTPQLDWYTNLTSLWKSSRKSTNTTAREQVN